MIWHDLLCVMFGHRWLIGGDISQADDCARCGHHYPGVVWIGSPPRMVCKPCEANAPKDSSQ